MKSQKLKIKTLNFQPTENRSNLLNTVTEQLKRGLINADLMKIRQIGMNGVKKHVKRERTKDKTVR